LTRISVIAYREKLETKIKKLKIVTFIQGTKLYQLYDTIRRLTE